MLFSGSLSPCVYNDETLLDEVKKFEARGGSIEVLVQNPEQIEQNGANQFLSDLLSLTARGRVKIYEVLDQNPLKNVDTHFLVSDDRMYRIEVDIDKKTAISSFNDTQRDLQLRDTFDTCAKENTREYQLVAA